MMDWMAKYSTGVMMSEVGHLIILMIGPWRLGSFRARNKASSCSSFHSSVKTETVCYCYQHYHKVHHSHHSLSLMPPRSLIRQRPRWQPCKPNCPQFKAFSDCPPHFHSPNYIFSPIDLDCLLSPRCTHGSLHQWLLMISLPLKYSTLVCLISTLRAVARACRLWRLVPTQIIFHPRWLLLSVCQQRSA